MVNNNSDDLAAKLSKLSEQERNVLKLRCQGLDYKTIHERLFISVAAVKQYMSRVYVKLGLDLLSRAERMKALYETFCPLLQKLEEAPGKLEIGSGEGAKGKQAPEPPEPVIPAYVPDMVDEDEYPLVYVAPVPLVSPKPEPKPGRTGLRGLIVGVILGICLGAGALYLILRPPKSSTTFVPQPTPAQPIPTAVPSDTPMPSATQEIPTQAPVVIVVTATPPPVTEVPTLTPLPQLQILFADDFDRGLSNSWSIISGNPVVVNGQVTADQNTWLRIGDSTWTDYSVQFSVQTADCWFYDHWNAIGVRVQDMDNMIAFKWASCESEWDIVKNGNWPVVPNSHVSNGDYGSGPITITITVQGGQFAVDINGARVSSFFNSAYQQGGVALRVGAKTQIDDFKITALQK